MNPASPPTQLRVLFAAGSGDVAQTLRLWNEGQPDIRIMAKAYSSAIYDLAKEHHWTLFCFPNNPCQSVRIGRICVIPLPKRSARGFRYFLEECRYGFALGRLAKRLDVDVIITATGMHPLGHLATSLAGTPIVVSLHNTLWIRGQHPPGGIGGWILKRSSSLLRKRVKQVVAVSEEIQRQIRAYWKLSDEQISIHVPQYSIESMPQTPPNLHPPHRVLFAGRIAPYKGVDDLLEAARLLEDTSPGKFQWVIAGDGVSLKAHQEHATSLRLDHCVEFIGQVDRATLIRQVEQCFVTIIPTRTTFNEGLGKLPLEGAIMGRPGLVSSVVPAIDLLGQAAEPIQPNDPQSIADALTSLSNFPDHYQLRQRACERVRTMTTDPTLSFHAAIERAVGSALE